MKVSCDFLPSEYKSFLLDTKFLVVSMVIFVATFVSVSTNLAFTAKTKSVLNKNKDALTTEVAEVSNRLRAITYNQAAIQELKTKFEFIQQAMGAKDYPYLRFYQSLEDALPRTAETGLKRVWLQRLNRMGGERYSVTGSARRRSDVTSFEKRMIVSKTKVKSRTNFTDVKVVSNTYNGKDDNWTFEMQFVFLP